MVTYDPYTRKKSRSKISWFKIQSENKRTDGRTRPIALSSSLTRSLTSYRSACINCHICFQLLSINHYLDDVQHYIWRVIDGNTFYAILQFFVASVIVNESKGVSQMNWTELNKLTQLQDTLLVTRVSVTKLIGCGSSVEFGSVHLLWMRLQAQYLATVYDRCDLTAGTSRSLPMTGPLTSYFTCTALHAPGWLQHCRPACSNTGGCTKWLT